MTALWPRHWGFLRGGSLRHGVSHGDVAAGQIASHLDSAESADWSDALRKHSRDHGILVTAYAQKDQSHPLFWERRRFSHGIPYARYRSRARQRDYCGRRLRRLGCKPCAAHHSTNGRDQARFRARSFSATQSSRSWVFLILSLVLVCAAFALPAAQPTGLGIHSDVGQRTDARAFVSRTATVAPVSLHRAIEGTLDSAGVDGNFAHAVGRFGATYTDSGAWFGGPGLKFHVARGSIGRIGSMSPIPSGLSVARTSVSYGNASVEESYRSVRSGIEQSFRVGKRPPGSGRLVIDLAISGISVTGTGNLIDLRDARGQIGATYSNLRVTDALGGSVPARMRSN